MNKYNGKGFLSSHKAALTANQQFKNYQKRHEEHGNEPNSLKSFTVTLEKSSPSINFEDVTKNLIRNFGYSAGVTLALAFLVSVTAAEEKQDDDKPENSIASRQPSYNSNNKNHFYDFAMAYVANNQNNPPPTTTHIAPKNFERTTDNHKKESTAKSSPSQTPKIDIKNSQEWKVATEIFSFINENAPVIYQTPKLPMVEFGEGAAVIVRPEKDTDDSKNKFENLKEKVRQKKIQFKTQLMQKFKEKMKQKNLEFSISYSEKNAFETIYQSLEEIYSLHIDVALTIRHHGGDPKDFMRIYEYLALKNSIKYEFVSLKVDQEIRQGINLSRKIMLIGRDTKTSLNDPKTWNEDTIVVDYYLFEKPFTMKEIKEGNKNYILGQRNMFYYFFDSRNTWAPEKTLTLILGPINSADRENLKKYLQYCNEEISKLFNSPMKYNFPSQELSEFEEELENQEVRFKKLSSADYGSTTENALKGIEKDIKKTNLDHSKNKIEKNHKRGTLEQLWNPFDKIITYIAKNTYAKFALVALLVLVVAYRFIKKNSENKEITTIIDNIKKLLNEINNKLYAKKYNLSNKHKKFLENKIREISNKIQPLQIHGLISITVNNDIFTINIDKKEHDLQLEALIQKIFPNKDKIYTFAQNSNQEKLVIEIYPEKINNLVKSTTAEKFIAHFNEVINEIININKKQKKSEIDNNIQNKIEEPKISENLTFDKNKENQEQENSQKHKNIQNEIKKNEVPENLLSKAKNQQQELATLKKQQEKQKLHDFVVKKLLFFINKNDLSIQELPENKFKIIITRKPTDKVVINLDKNVMNKGKTVDNTWENIWAEFKDHAKIINPIKPVNENILSQGEKLIKINDKNNDGSYEITLSDIEKLARFDMNAYEKKLSERLVMISSGNRFSNTSSSSNISSVDLPQVASSNKNYYSLSNQEDINTTTTTTTTNTNKSEKQESRNNNYSDTNLNPTVSAKNDITTEPSNQSKEQIYKKERENNGKNNEKTKSKNKSTADQKLWRNVADHYKTLTINVNAFEKEKKLNKLPTYRKHQIILDLINFFNALNNFNKQHQILSAIEDNKDPSYVLKNMLVHNLNIKAFLQDKNIDSIVEIIKSLLDLKNIFQKKIPNESLTLSFNSYITDFKKSTLYLESPNTTEKEEKEAISAYQKKQLSLIKKLLDELPKVAISNDDKGLKKRLPEGGDPVTLDGGKFIILMVGTLINDLKNNHSLSIEEIRDKLKIPATIKDNGKIINSVKVLNKVCSNRNILSHEPDENETLAKNFNAIKEVLPSNDIITCIYDLSLLNKEIKKSDNAPHKLGENQHIFLNSPQQQNKTKHTNPSNTTTATFNG